MDLAAFNGHTACLKVLLAAGASVRSLNVFGTSSLHQAVLNGRVACVRALIAAGSDVNFPNYVGDTPFSRALWGWNPCILKILLRAGANMHTGSAKRNQWNPSVWALVDAIREVGGWANYVARHPPATFANVVTKATRGKLPSPIPLEIATFLVPPGGF